MKENSVNILKTGSIVLLLIAVVVYFYFNTQSGSDREPQDSSKTEKITLNDKEYSQILKNIYEYNKTLPKKLDEYTRIDKIKINEMTILYTYTILLNNSELSQLKTPTTTKDMETMGIKELCTNTDTKLLLTTGITYKRTYKTLDNKYFFSYVVSNENCNTLVIE